MTMRFLPEYARFIRRKAKVEGIPQVDVVQTSLHLNGKEVKKGIQFKVFKLAQ